MNNFIELFAQIKSFGIGTAMMQSMIASMAPLDAYYIKISNDPNQYALSHVDCCGLKVNTTLAFYPP